ncbi:transcriptional regulator family: Fungal Specific TF [Paecilomyces variotii]|nr:transcriptional regulator family: Fungal Specific TF [Paecilomyces variotii]KAJ9275599.1 transcriptional regulator family: Fungal Specific TF [Paecilomyces variotii]KAJ9326169.1 transcriptional regulator family: Fungal Specific TF [Paecilomyces variotii]KAJ9332973.1 transcriptional regulator family: Fungal Specific TF [Paecilomyces variotii]KAJ9342663.1 transcriptional regulator family: Fungal Specific TF [Paecilomyces variotii]
MARSGSQESTDPLSPSGPRPHIRLKQRVAHTKSRNGCFACKNRRVKCNEERPICGACSLRGDECIFPRPQTRQHHIRGRDTVSHDATNSGTLPNLHAGPLCPLDFNAAPTRTSDPDDEFRSGLHMRDLNLLQHYILHTSRSLSLNPRKLVVWERVIPDLASENAFLMHLVLALAGLHILKSRKSDKHRLTDTHICKSSLNESIDPRSVATDTAELPALIEHHQKGLQGLQQILAATANRNAEVLFAGSMLVAAFAFASLGVETPDPLSRTSRHSPTRDSIFMGPSKVADRPQIHWLRLVRGVGSIVQHSWNNLKLGRLRPLLIFNNANDDWKLVEPEPVLGNSLPGNVLSESLSAFVFGAQRAISKLRECLESQQAMSSVHGDVPGSNPRVEANWNIPLDPICVAQDQTIAVVEDMYMRTIYVLRLQPVEPRSSDHDTQAEIEDAAVASWPHLIPEAFVSSLDPDNLPDMTVGLSFVILAHLYLLLALLDNLWYLGENFGMEIEKIHTLIAEFGSPELTELMAWPLSVVRLQRNIR